MIDKSRIGMVNKNRMSKANKSRIDKTNIKASKKASARAITNTDNSTNDSNKVIDWYTSHVDFAFTVFAAANCIYDSNLIVFKKTPSNITTFTFNKFYATFAIHANTTLERKLNISKSNLFLFAINH